MFKFVVVDILPDLIAICFAFPTFIVITVPAYFHDGAKQKTLLASKIAFANKKDETGNAIKVETVLLAEPPAAAMA